MKLDWSDIETDRKNATVVIDDCEGGYSYAETDADLDAVLDAYETASDYSAMKGADGQWEEGLPVIILASRFAAKGKLLGAEPTCWVRREYNTPADWERREPSCIVRST